MKMKREMRSYVLLALGILGLYLAARITGIAGQTVMVQTLLMAFLLGIGAVALWLRKTGQWRNTS